MTLDQKALAKRLYEQWGAKLAAVVTGKFRVPHEAAAEAVQTVFVTLLERKDLLERIGAFDEDQAFRYLLKMIYHEAIHELRRAALLESRSANVLEQLLAHGDDADAHRNTETLEVARHEVSRLPKLYREVLERLLFRHQSALEIAQELDRPVNTVYQQIHRGLGQLRPVLRKALQR